MTKLEPYYKAIEREGANLGHFTEKQDFLNSVYEQFFQKFSPNVADTHGIVYTPRETVDFMCNSVEAALKEHFGYTLSSPEVVILDPCTGTGNFIVNLIERIPGRALREAYHNRLFANEVMLLPYYVASLNVEHAYYERIRSYESIDDLCFVDTLDMAQPKQIGMFTPANTDRVEPERKAAVTSKDRTSIHIDDPLTLAGMPPEVFDYRLGSKSAVEWIIDQYQVKGESDPNREDNPGYIVRLVGKVVRVSIETVRIVKTLPDFRASATQ